MPELNLGKRYFAVGKAIKSLNEVQKDAKHEIEKLIKDGIYEFESVPCLCASPVENDLLLATVDRYGLKHHTVICRKCGLIRTNPRLTQASYNNFYQNWYRQLYSGWRHLDQDRFREQFHCYLSRGEKIVAFLRSHHVEITGKKVLEIGCGGGWNLLAFERQDAKTIGFDYGKYIKFGKKLYGLDLYNGGIREAIEKGMKADIVILSHVVEHFTDPMEELNNLRSLLNSNGICYLETPGIFSIHKSYIDPMKYLQNAHTYCFSKLTLSNLTMSCGYEIQYRDEFIRMLCKPSSICSVDIKVEPNHARLVVEYLKDCEKKRIRRGLLLFLRRFHIKVLKSLGIYPLAKRLLKTRHSN